MTPRREFETSLKNRRLVEDLVELVRRRFLQGYPSAASKIAIVPPGGFM